MHHYVSFKSQGTSDRPWSSVFGEPSLVLSAEAGVHTFTYTGKSYGGWGYVCPELEDTSFHGVLEYCLQEWRSANNKKPEWTEERKGECGGGPWAMVNTYFWPGTVYATEMPGSTNTFEVGSAGSGHFEAKITAADLVNASRLINAECAGWHLSENPENYALIGVEQGMEGWDGVSVIGGYGANLQLRTEYNSLPPEATTSAASGLEPLQATLNGNVNPKGTSTHYFFQYGQTTSYGLSTSEGSAGSGQAPVGVSTNVTLQPGTVYHYRIVASSEGGTVYGGDQIFTTPGPVEGVTAAATGLLETKATLNGTVNPRGYDAKYYFQYGTSTSYGSSTPEGDAGGGAGAVPESAIITGLEPGIPYHYRLVATSGGITSYGKDETLALTEEVGSRWVVRDVKTWDQWLYYRGSEGAVWELELNSTGWHSSRIGGQMAPNTVPTAVRDPITGTQWVYYQGTNGGIWAMYMEQNVWHLGTSAIGGHAAPGTSPTVMRDQASGDQWVYYQGSEGGIWGMVLTQSGWQVGTSAIGGHAASGTSPVAVRDAPTGDQWVYYQGTNGGIWGMLLTQSGWQVGTSAIGGKAAAGTSPAVMRDAATGDQWIYYQGTSGGIWGMGLTQSGWQVGTSAIGGKAAAGTSPAVMRDPVTWDQWVYYQGSEGGIWGMDLTAETGWQVGISAIGGKAAAGTSPAVMRDPATWDQWVYYQGSEGGIWGMDLTAETGWQVGKEPL